MTKDILLTISGLQFMVEEVEDTESNSPDPMEVISAGSYYWKNGKHYVLYDEVTEGFSEVTKNIIKVNEDCVDITKRGVSNVHMIFEKNKKNVSYYHTPYGSIMIGIDAKKVEVKESENQIHVDVEYGLELNYEHVADCNIKMNIQSKEAGEFRLN